MAADIKQGFTRARFDKQQLRNWDGSKQFGAAATDEQRDALLRRMRETLERLNSLAEQATVLDDGQPPASGRRRGAMP